MSVCVCMCLLQRAIACSNTERKERESERDSLNNAPYIRLGGLRNESDQTHDIRTSEHLSGEEEEEEGGFCECRDR